MKNKCNIQYINKHVWRCRSSNQLHDIKKDISCDSIFESIKVPINVIYYLTFNCFLEHYSLNQIYISNENFWSIMGTFNILWNLILKYYHKKWNESKLGSEPVDGGVSRIEIDESEIIGRENQILWMFGFIDRYDNTPHVFCSMENRTKENLLPIITKNIYPYEYEREIDLRTPIYSDCFASYRENDLANMDFILHRVNHSVWFGQGRFHTNT